MSVIAPSSPFYLFGGFEYVLTIPRLLLLISKPDLLPHLLGKPKTTVYVGAPPNLTCVLVATHHQQIIVLAFMVILIQIP